MRCADCCANADVVDYMQIIYILTRKLSQQDLTRTNDYYYDDYLWRAQQQCDTGVHNPSTYDTILHVYKYFLALSMQPFRN